MHRRAGPVVEVVALGRAGAGERLPGVREFPRQEPPLQLLLPRRPPRPAPFLGALPRGIPGLGQLMVVGSADPLAGPVPQVPTTVERVRGLRAVVPVRTVPPAVFA